MLKNYCRIIFCLLFIGGFFICPFFAFGAVNDVVINEIAWMGNDISTADEWIEFYNNTNSPIDIKDWSIYGADTEKCLNFSDADGNTTTIIPEYGYLIYANHEDDIKDINEINIVDIWDTSIGMNNTFPGQIILYNSLNCQNGAVNMIDQTDEWLAGNNDIKQTMEKTDTDWQTSLDTGGTPKAQNSSGAINEITDETTSEETVETTTNTEASPSVPNRPPTAEAGTDIIALVSQELSFDASHSLDLDNDKLIFFWNFGDGATETEEITKHTYLYPGQYIVSLLVSDDEFSDLDIITINIYSQSIVISEFSNKWIEIFNQSNQVANLTNWQLRNIKASSSPFVFPANSLMASNQFLVLRQEITKIELDDISDQIQLIYPDGSIGAEVSYLNEDNKNFCIAFDNNDYFWTNIPTPGSANIISIGIKTQEENFPKNNPEPIINEIKEIPEILAINLTKNQNFDTQNISTTSINNLQTESFQETQPASLIQKVQSNQKSKLILYISIIISVSLMLSWVIILVRSKVKFH